MNATIRQTNEACDAARQVREELGKGGKLRLAVAAAFIGEASALLLHSEDATERARAQEQIAAVVRELEGDA